MIFSDRSVFLSKIYSRGDTLVSRVGQIHENIGSRSHHDRRIQTEYGTDTITEREKEGRKREREKQKKTKI